jgi:AcrR family transcriptional regulator
MDRNGSASYSQTDSRSVIEASPLVRTLNPTVRAVRRDAILDVAERLMRTCGYEEMSVQDIQDELGVSRGAIYHYFGSKADILEAVLERMTDTVMSVIQPLANDLKLTPLARLRQVFAVAGQWKAERKELMIALVQAWYSDHNTLVRVRLGHVVAARLAPLIADILREGKAEGVFRVGSPDRAAAILVAMLLDSGETLSPLILARLAGTVPFEDVEHAVAAYNEAFERILGLAAGSFEIVDSSTLRFWLE